MRHLIKITAFAALMGLSAPLASAGPDANQVRVELSFSAGEPTEILYERMNDAVKDACRIRGEAGLTVRRRENACRIELLTSMVDQSGRVDVARLHHDNTGQQAPILDRALANGAEDTGADQTG